MDYLSWLNRSMICVLPLSWLKKMKRLQCINHILLCTWFKGDGKFCSRNNNSQHILHIQQILHILIVKRTWHKPLSLLSLSNDLVLQEQYPSFASVFQPLTSPTKRWDSFHCLCIKPYTDTDSQRHLSSFHIQTETWHTDIVPLSGLDQSGKRIIPLC